MPFSVETFGRWGSEATRSLRDAVDAVAERDPQVAAAGHWGKVALLNAWHTQLSVALQKNNAACVLQAGRIRGQPMLAINVVERRISMIFSGRPLRRLAGATSRADVEEEVEGDKEELQRALEGVLG